ncbi:preprotein translocase subunit YajC [Helcococcus kunzii]|uniref:preprotein translocase subunit YajC n=1 Tax=Helcococcus kunzii TaxID=40091 RepID=UPI0038AA5A8A
MFNTILAAQAGNPGALYSSLFMFAAVGLAFYFLIIKPQKKQQQEYQKTMQSLKVGDTIITRSGLRGKVIELNDKTIIVETGKNNTQLEFLKGAINHIENNSGEYSSNTTNFGDSPVGDLSYGEDERFINKLNELKEDGKDYDLLLEDIFEFIVVENDTASISIQNKFRLPEERVNNILSQLEELGIVSAEDEYGKREILVDPR